MKPREGGCIDPFPATAGTGRQAATDFSVSGTSGTLLSLRSVGWDPGVTDRVPLAGSRDPVQPGYATAPAPYGVHRFAFFP